MSEPINPRTPLSATSPANWISLHARHQPNGRCLVDSSGSVHTFGEVDARVNRLARALSIRGLERGDRIGILATDSVDYMVVLLASLKLGTTYVPFNFRLAPAEIVNLAMFGELRALVVADRYAALVAPIQAVCPRLDVVASIDESPGLESLGSWIDAVDDGSDVVVETELEDVIGLMFTSGTTGIPKGVMQSLRMLRSNTIAGIVDQRLLPDDFRYSASPMFHVAGMGSIMYGIARGFPSLVLEQFDPAVLLRWIRDEGVTSFLAMPTMLVALLRQPGIRDHSYPHLRGVMYGGSPITPALLREALGVFDRCGFYNGFGAGTEAGGQTMFFPEDHLRALAGEEHLLGSIGRPMFGVELRLCDDDLNDVEHGEVGEIVTRSDSVMSGYLNDPDRTAQAVVGGWFRAGDLAWMDDEGYLFLAGRKGDMIIRGGENVYPVEIESVIADHPAVAEVAVVGLPDDHWGEIVAAAVIAAPGQTIDADELRAWCREHLAAYKSPAVVITVADMPRNVNGKVQKHLLAEQLRASTGPVVG